MLGTPSNVNSELSGPLLGPHVEVRLVRGSVTSFGENERPESFGLVMGIVASLWWGQNVFARRESLSVEMLGS